VDWSFFFEENVHLKPWGSFIYEISSDDTRRVTADPQIFGRGSLCAAFAVKFPEVDLTNDHRWNVDLSFHIPRLTHED
jgi:hypothetical protein